MTNTHITIGGHKVSAGKVYSTSEVKTGDVWTDGKPIYRKSITTTGLTDNAFTIQNISWDNTNLDTLVSMNGSITRHMSGAVEMHSLNGYLGDNQRTFTKLAPTFYSVAMKFPSLVSADVNVTIEYTKTTD